MFEVKEKPRLVERAFLLSVIRREDEREEAESLLEELSELVLNLGIEVCWKTVVRTRKTFPGHILGKGKLEEILNQVRELNCDVIIFDNEGKLMFMALSIEFDHNKDSSPSKIGPSLRRFLSRSSFS